MNRRTFLRAGAGLGALSLAGCAGLLESRSTGNAPVPENRPDGIYVPGHVEGMEMVDTGQSGDSAAGLMYSYAHRFWTVTGDTVERTSIEDGDDVHLMASVWDPETRTVLPETGLSLEIRRDGSLVSEEVIYPMLSQPMGFHYGANFGLEGDGTYTVRLSIGGVSTRRTGAFRGRFGEPTTIDIPFEYSQSARDEISYEVLDRGGERGSVDPREMGMMPDAFAPAVEDLPGQVLGSGRSDDAVLVATVLKDPPAGVDGEGTYLAVSARTRYNRMVIPAMGLAGTLTRDGGPIFDGRLTRTLDPDLGYHYGAVVGSVESGDELTLSVTTQPQTARHEGYETAFGGLKGGMGDVTLSV
jgi:hypothetical protein